MQRVRHARFATSTGAEQHQLLEAFRECHRELLGNHATETDTDDDTPVPTNVVEQIGTIPCVLRHGERTVDDAGTPETALIVGENGCERAQVVDDRSSRFERRARTVEEQNTRAVSGKRVVQFHAGPENMPRYSSGFSIGGSFS